MTADYCDAVCERPSLPGAEPEVVRCACRKDRHLDGFHHGSASCCPDYTWPTGERRTSRT